MAYKRLIEHRLPLAEVSTESAREKSIRHGHISTLHIWWTRKPLAASRAAVFATLVPDTDENYELVKKIVPWEAVKDGSSPDILEARRKVLEANGGVPPKVLDPFGGGGAIPLEALRLGCEVYSLDLNPVAHIIQKATLEFPQKFGQPNSRPVPEYIFEKDQQAQASSHGKVSAKNKGKATQQGGLGLGSSAGEWERGYKQNPLATDVRYWADWIFEHATDELKEYYPLSGENKKPIAYMWARTIICSNPACRAEVPTKTNWWLSKKDGKRKALKPIIDFSAKSINFEVVGVGKDESWPDKGTMQRDNANCPVCGNSMNGKYLREAGKSGNLGERLLATIEGDSEVSGKAYFVAGNKEREAYLKSQEFLKKLRREIKFNDLSPLPEEEIVEWSGVFNAPLYGLNTWGSLFNSRQAAALITLVGLVHNAEKSIREFQKDIQYCDALVLYLGIIVDRIADKSSLLVTYEPDREKVSHTFTRQALPMIWDCCEASVLADIGWPNATEWVAKVILHTSSFSNNMVSVIRGSATKIPLDDNSLCKGQNSVNPVWDGSLTFTRETEKSAPVGWFFDERTPEPTLSR